MSEGILTYAEAERISEVACAELRSNRWSAEARGDLALISSYARGSMDHLAGHAGFEAEIEELEERLTYWAENVDYRTFMPPVSLLDRVRPYREVRRAA